MLGLSVPFAGVNGAGASDASTLGMVQLTSAQKPVEILIDMQCGLQNELVQNHGCPWHDRV